MSDYTHDQLVNKAGNFLKYKKNCRVVLEELDAATRLGEIPDVIGWKSNISYLIECKTSRSDFLKDQKKKFRKGSKHANYWGMYGMGRYRYYFVPKGLVEPEEIPDNWGLVYLDGRSYKEVITADGDFYDNPHATNTDETARHNESTIESLQNEIAMLVSALGRNE